MLKDFTSALFKKNKGFTLVELMVVSGIIIFMTAFVLINYRAGGQQLALNRSAHKLAQDIRRAQEMAMSAAICELCGDIVPPRYGIYIAEPDSNPTSYTLFADTGNYDGLFVWTGSPLDRDQIIKEIDFESSVYLGNIEVDGCNIGDVPFDQRHSHLTFEPPDPETEIRVGFPQPPPHPPIYCTGIVLTLGVEGYSQTKTVKINNAGLIYVE